MHITYVIRTELNAVITTAYGILSVEDILDYWRRLKADPEFRPEYHRVFDYSHVKSPGLNAQDLARVAKENDIGSAGNGKTIVVPGPGFGPQAVAKLYNALAEAHKGREHVICETTEDAMAWLEEAAKSAN